MCDRALLGDFVKGHNQVRKATLKKAADEAFGNVNAGARHKRAFQWLPAIGNLGSLRRINMPAVLELFDKQLAILEGRESKTGGNLVFDNTMIREVKKFQLARGLLPDGIVGPQTIIHLNTVTGSGAPLLSKEVSD